MNVFELFIIALVASIGFFFVKALLPSSLENVFLRFGCVFMLSVLYIGIGIVNVCGMIFAKLFQRSTGSKK